jgi:hypothetical protein
MEQICRVGLAWTSMDGAAHVTSHFFHTALLVQAHTAPQRRQPLPFILLPISNAHPLGTYRVLHYNELIMPHHESVRGSNEWKLR